MKLVAIALLAMLMGFGAVVDGAQAKRLGGGKSTGISRNSGVMSREGISSKPATAPAPSATTAPAAPQSGMSRWMGPLAGIAAGLGIAALFSHFGMGAGMADMVLILLVVAGAVFVVRLLLRRKNPARGMQPAMQYAGPGGGMRHQEPGGFTSASFGAAGSPSPDAHPAADVPADFDVEGFLRQSKLSFIRLQAANDRGDMEDIRHFCSPELAAEIQMQYQERSRQAQQTDILHLEAKLLDVSSESGRMLASVRFFGTIREEAGSPGEAFNEVWHMVGGQGSGQNWRIVGIQQG